VQFLDAAVTELKISTGSTDREGIKERIASRLERIEASYGRRISRGTGVLATIGATAPFVGLFGTVWGIMNSFIGISKSHTTNLAVVAPGIAEALLAAAFGGDLQRVRAVDRGLSRGAWRYCSGGPAARQPRPRARCCRTSIVCAPSDAIVRCRVSKRRLLQCMSLLTQSRLDICHLSAFRRKSNSG
jgi:hypothetical protein